MEKIPKGYRLSSGREFYANEGLVSIAHDADGRFRIREGYDGLLMGATGHEYDVPDPGERDPNWTVEERREPGNQVMRPSVTTNVSGAPVPLPTICHPPRPRSTRTVARMSRLADFMIAQWSAFKEST